MWVQLVPVCACGDEKKKNLLLNCYSVCEKAAVTMMQADLTVQTTPCTHATSRHPTCPITTHHTSTHTHFDFNFLPNKPLREHPGAEEVSKYNRIKPTKESRWIDSFVSTRASQFYIHPSRTVNIFK